MIEILIKMQTSLSIPSWPQVGWILKSYNQSSTAFVFSPDAEDWIKSYFRNS